MRGPPYLKGVIMLKQMAWLSPGDEDDSKILHLRIDASQPWQPYTAFPTYAVADYPIEEVSRGFATFQKLICEGWTLLSSNQTQQLSLFQRPGNAA